MLRWSLAWFPYFYSDCPWPSCELQFVKISEFVISVLVVDIWQTRYITGSRHVFTNFLNTSQRIFPSNITWYLFWFFQILETEKNSFFGPIRNLFCCLTEKYWWNKFVDSYLQNSWKHVLSSMIGLTTPTSIFSNKYIAIWTIMCNIIQIWDTTWNTWTWP